MSIRYACRHCNTEIGNIPFESVKDVINDLKKSDEGQGDHFLEYDQDGSMTVKCICEQCEQSLRMFPNYYALKKWLQ
ncbi:MULTISPECIES: anti-sigma-F factor Fin [Sporosarcina]|uniref:Anti-sigma-F factor Fin n=1 Tax=Sporosarcina contaminans TaxID=633403 RepID=A0ABW3TVG2_9BACL